MTIKKSKYKNKKTKMLSKRLLHNYEEDEEPDLSNKSI